MGRNNAAVEVVPAEDVGGDVVSTPLPVLAVEAAAAHGRGAGELTAEEEAARLKELNAALVVELTERREQVAMLTALVDQLTIAAKAGEADALEQESLEPAAAEQLEDGTAQEAAAAASKEEEKEKKKKKSDEQRAEISIGEPEKKQPEKKKMKKKAPARRALAHKGEKISTAATATATATAPAGDQDGDACEAGRAGRPRRVKKANTMYPSDTWAH